MGEQKNQASDGWMQTVSNGQIKLQDGTGCMCKVSRSSKINKSVQENRSSINTHGKRKEKETQ